MAAVAGVSRHPHQSSLSLNTLGDDPSPRTTSLESNEHEPDWHNENRKYEQQEQDLQETQHEDNSNQAMSIHRPESPNSDRSQTSDYRPESPGDFEQTATPYGSGDAASFDDDKETDDYYDQATQQQLLQEELQKLKDEGILPQSDEPVFDYDIAERVKQLNAELEQEESTPEKKNRRVIFKENLVEFSPSPDFRSEDREPARTEDQTDPNDLEVAKLTLNDADDNHKKEESRQRLRFQDEDSSEIVFSSGDAASSLPNGNYELDRLTNEGRLVNGASGGTDGSDQPDGNSQTMQQELDEQKQNEQVLLERNGKFELVNVRDLSAEERVMMGLAPTEEQNSNNSAHSSSGVAGYQPSPPPARKERPSTATGQGGVRRQQLAPRRIQSAKTHREVHGADGYGQSSSAFDWDARSSGYGMSPEQKAAMRKSYKMQLQRQREEDEQREDEKRRSQEESQQAFEWWVGKKREEDKQKRKEVRERKKKEEEEKEIKDPEGVFQAWVEKKNKLMKERRKKAVEERLKSLEQEAGIHDPEATYQAWLQNKKEQAKLEKKIRKKMDEEKEGAFYVRDRKECDKAFKEWVRSKNTQLREDRSIKHTAASHTQKKAKLSRKSRQLAKALQVAETYRYTDYYGYRF